MKGGDACACVCECLWMSGAEMREYGNGWRERGPLTTKPLMS